MKSTNTQWRPEVAYYVAWLNGHSVGRGTLAEVKTKAFEVFNSAAWQEWECDKPTILTITRGPRQSVVTSAQL